MYNPPAGQKMKTSVDSSFSKRLLDACEQFGYGPAHKYGRLTWLQTKLSEHNIEVSLETIRKWCTGASRPRDDKISILSRILEVDRAWLALGIQTAPPSRARANPQSPVTDGAAYILAGLIFMDGGRAVFPAYEDHEALDQHIDLYATIKGARYAFRIIVGLARRSTIAFDVPENASPAVILGFYREGTDVSIFEITPRLIDQSGKRQKEGFLLRLTRQEIRDRRVECFATRI